jgi:hypothetical protein
MHAHLRQQMLVAHGCSRLQQTAGRRHANRSESVGSLHSTAQPSPAMEGNRGGRGACGTESGATSSCPSPRLMVAMPRSERSRWPCSVRCRKFLLPPALSSAVLRHHLPAGLAASASASAQQRASAGLPHSAVNIPQLSPQANDMRRQVQEPPTSRPESSMRWCGIKSDPSWPTHLGRSHLGRSHLGRPSYADPTWPIPLGRSHLADPT